jgi:flagellar M-ring protein FliF
LPWPAQDCWAATTSTSRCSTSSKLGSSNFQQEITYQRALEGQLAQTIESIQGVSGAQVQLVLPNPQDQLFADSTQPSTAAVLLSGSTALDPGAVRGIAQLVASSVPSLQIDKVTITDSSGQLLWPTADSSGTGADGSLLSKQAAEARYDQSMAAQVNAMLAQTLGPGKAQVVVNADLNTNQTTSDALVYANKGVPLQQHTETETLSGAGAATGGTAGGTAGTTANIPTYAQAGGAGNSKYSHKITDTTLGVNKTVTHSVIAPGAINRQAVSVLVDRTVPASSLPALKAAVQSAAGIVPARGDTLAFGQVAFTNPTLKPAAAPAPNVLNFAKYGAIGVAVLAFLLFVSRLLRRREREPLAGNATWLRELETPRTLAALERETAEQPTQVMQLRSPVNVAKRQVEDLVERDPDRVAQQVRAWMAED